MGLFKDKKSKEQTANIVFDKEEIIREILNENPTKNDEKPWIIFEVPSLKCDLLCIRNIEIKEEINITENPFSHYKRTEPSIYQMVVAAYLPSNKDDLFFEEKITNWLYFFACSYEEFYRKLEEIKK
jgi:hypothetical protein